MRNVITLGMCLALLGACGERQPPEKSVFDTQVQALKKARAVDQKQQEALQKQREQIERETENK
jgi:hypothetical protein